MEKHMPLAVLPCLQDCATNIAFTPLCLSSGIHQQREHVETACKQQSRLGKGHVRKKNLDVFFHFFLRLWTWADWTV